MKKVLIFNLIMLYFLQISIASHLAGGEVTYRSLGNKQYEVRFVVYRDCNGVGPQLPSSLDYKVFKGSDSSVFASLNVKLFSTTKATSQLGTCSLASGCFEEGLYYDTVTISNDTVGYHVLWAECCRNLSVINLQYCTGSSDNTTCGSSGCGAKYPFGMIWHTIIPRDTFQNNSPKFLDQGILFLCAQKTSTIKWLNVFDKDGDSLVYSFIKPLSPPCSGSTITIDLKTGLTKTQYQSGYSVTYPFGSSSGAASIDPTSGVMKLNPTKSGIYTLSVCVEDYRVNSLTNTAKYMGRVIRDFQIFVSSCSNSTNMPPKFTNKDTVVQYIQANKPFCFNVTAEDSNANDTVTLWAKSSIFKGKNSLFKSNWATFPGDTAAKTQGWAKSKFCWTPNDSQETKGSPYVVTFYISDNYCHLVEKTYMIYVGHDCPTLDFNAKKSSCGVNQLVKFSATGNELKTPHNTFWDFGKGKGFEAYSDTTSTTFNTGIYSIRLMIVFKATGSKCYVNKTGYLVIGGTQLMSFGGKEKFLLDCDTPYQFSITDYTPGIVKRNWYLDNKLQTDTGRTLFTKPGYNKGVQSVKLTVYDEISCSYSLEKKNYLFSGYTNGDTTIKTVCDSFNFHNKKYYSSGIYRDTFMGSYGCDSIITLVLTINKSPKSTLFAQACDFYNYNNNKLTTSGSYKYTFQAASGCDSQVTLNLIIHKSYFKTVYISTCKTSYSFIGKTYTKSGRYIYYLTTIAGCDSTILLDLKFVQPKNYLYNKTACDSYDFFGKTLTKSGTYDTTFKDPNGCDSSFTVYLTIKKGYSKTVHYCTRDTSYTFLGKTFSKTGVYTFSFTNAVGCDSNIILDLIIGPASTSTVSKTVCDTSYIFNGKTMNKTGTYTFTFSNVYGCDSVINLDLTFIKIDTALNHVHGGLMAMDSLASYQWIDCDSGGKVITDQTSRTYNCGRKLKGYYAVILSKDGCVDTSNCTLCNAAVAIEEHRNFLQIYPNPTTGTFTLTSEENLQHTSVKLINITGQTLFEKQNLSGKNFHFNFANQPNGIYFVEVKYGGRISRVKVVKE